MPEEGAAPIARSWGREGLIGRRIKKKTEVAIRNEEMARKDWHLFPRGETGPIGGTAMERYTIRILYRNRENPAKLVGLLEEEGIAEKRGFVSMEGLWRILNTMDSGKGRGRSGSPRESGRTCAENMVDLVSLLREE
jgi:hypothetical protein